METFNIISVVFLVLWGMLHEVRLYIARENNNYLGGKVAECMNKIYDLEFNAAPKATPKKSDDFLSSVMPMFDKLMKVAENLNKDKGDLDTVMNDNEIKKDEIIEVQQKDINNLLDNLNEKCNELAVLKQKLLQYEK